MDPRPLSWWVTELERMWGGHGEPREGNPSWLGLEGKKCVGKIRRKRTPGCFIWLYSFVFLGGNDLGVEILVTRYVMLFFVG